jgi:predicted N-acyltransferase
VKVAPLDTNADSYQRLATSHGSVFNSVGWLQIYGEGVTVYGLYNLNDELIGAFNVFNAKKVGLSYYIVPPFSPSNGLFFINPAVNAASRNSFEKELHTAIAGLFKQLKGFLKISAFPVGISDMQVYYWNGFKVTPNYTYRLALNGSEDDLFASLSSEKRKSIRKAGKDGLQVSLTTDMKVVRELILKTFTRKNKKLNETLLDKILFGFANATNSFAYVAQADGSNIACTFCVTDKDTCYYLFGGYDEKNRHHGAGPACMWNAILHAKSKGITVFDFEGSMLPEVEKYFREFGGVQHAYYSIHRAWLPVEMALKLIMRNRF